MKKSEKEKLMIEAFRTKVVNALDQSIKDINALEESSFFPDRKEKLVERMESIVLSGLDVKENLDIMYNF